MHGERDPLARRWDAFGLVASGVCMVHCTALPLVLATLPALGFLAARSVHVVLGAFVLGAALAAFVPGYRRHRRAFVVALGAVGALALGGAMMVGDDATGTERVVTLAGSAMLVVAHVLNLRLRPVTA